MKNQFLFIIFLFGIQGFVCGMEPESPKTPSEIDSSRSTPSKYEYAKIDHGTRSVVFRNRIVGHIIEDVTVIARIGKEVHRTTLTEEQCRAAVNAQYVNAMKPKGSCLKY